MTPIPPSVTSLTEEPKGDATDGDATEGLKSPEASDDADDSLEAILLQAGAKPPEAAAPKALGSKTLMGIGIEGLNLPALLRAEEKKRKVGKKSARTEAEPDVPVDDLVEEDAAATNPASEAAMASSPENKHATSLLDDVAQALNVQASEVRDRARGRLPGMPASGAGASKPMLPMTIQQPGQRQAEFEDPSEGPTALTPGMIAIADAEKAAGQKSALDAELEAEEEAVVLGHAVQSGSAKYVQARTSESRPVAVPPVPGLPTASPAVVGPPPGVALKLPTPAGGLPLPLSGRTRLPTPVPGAPGQPVPPSVAAISYQTLPFGIASARVSDLTATAPSTPISLEASRRFAASANASIAADAVPVRRTLRITAPVRRFATVLPAVLTAHVKLATLSLAGLIAVTFAGGLFVGIQVGKGPGRAEPSPATHVVTSTPVPSPAPAPTTPANPTATTATTTTTGSAVPAAPAPAASPSGAASGAVIPAAEPGAAMPPSETVVAPLPEPQPSEAASDSKPIRRSAAVVRAPRPRKTVASGTATDFPLPGPKVAAVKPTAHPAPGATTASKPMATSATSKAVATGTAKPVANNATGKPMANNSTAKAAAKSKTKTTWHDPFAD